MTRSWLGYAIMAGGLLAVGAGVAMVRKRSTGLSGLGRGSWSKPTGRTVSKLAPPPKLTEVRTNGGMTLKHYKAKHIPIESRVRLIQDMVREATMDPEMRKLALSITRHCPERDGECEARAVYDWMKGKNGGRWIRYTGDVAPIVQADGTVEGVDLFQGPKRTLEFGGGDCDDHSGLAATLLVLNGVPAKLRVTAPNRDDDWAHIYGMAGTPKTGPRKWVATDTTLPGDQRFGKEAPFAKYLDFPA